MHTVDFHTTVFRWVAICFALGLVLMGVVGCQERRESKEVFELFSDLQIGTIESPSAEQNAYIVHLDNSSDCLVVDAGYDADQIIRSIKRHNLNPVAVLVTHGHHDHFVGNKDIKDKWPQCKIYVGKDDAAELIDTQAADITLSGGEQITVAGVPISVIHLPGHSRGHMLYRIEREEGIVIFVGDVIFEDSIGRSDFPGGSASDLIYGIHEKIMTQPPDTILYPGHGPKTTVKRESQHNPFLQMEHE